MFKNTYQSGLLSIFYSCGSAPLAIWDMEVHNGHIKRLTDNEVNSVVLEIVSTNVAVTYITCPKNNQTLGIKLPFLVMIVKNLKRYFSFEITVLDDKNMRRRFKISNFQSTTKIKPFCTTMPIGLAGGWNQIQFNLADFTRRAYASQYVETLRVQVNANVRIRRIYFSDRLYTEEELPQDYKLYLPLSKRDKKEKKVSKPELLKKPEKSIKEKVSPAGTPQEAVPPAAGPIIKSAEELKESEEAADATTIDERKSKEIPGEGAEPTAQLSAENIEEVVDEVEMGLEEEEGVPFNADALESIEATTEGTALSEDTDYLHADDEED